MWRFLVGLLVLVVLGSTRAASSIELQKDETSISINFNTATNLFDLVLSYDGTAVLSATLGHDLDLTDNDIDDCTGLDNCYQFSDGSRLHVNTHIDNGFTLYWKSENTSKIFKDCIDLDTASGTHWYGGPERNYQYYPIEQLVMTDMNYATHEDNFTAIAEPYWLNSLGAYLFVDFRVPLFVDQNNEYEGRSCFIAKQEDPYQDRTKIVLNYTLVGQPNVRSAHMHAVNHFMSKPTGHPNYKMISRPIWSTWARYYKEINDSIALDFANEIVNNGFADGQFELDDYWETCYGSLVFGDTFSDITNTVSTIKAMNFRFTLWVHPFVNIYCEDPYSTGIDNGFFATARDGNMYTTWWNSVEGNDTVHIDFTNPEAREWFADKLQLLRDRHGIDAFKFDAGETSFATPLPVLTGDVETTPNVLTSDYVLTCAQFGDLVEIRTGTRTQFLPIFVRMIDKDSVWGVNNGLYTLITTLLIMNLNGYVMVLPDMVGGNGYEGSGGRPGAELYVRWLQANTFMPAIQFSVVPWDFDNVYDSSGNSYSVVELAHTFVDLHEQYSDYIVECMENSIAHGYPVNAPIWWVDPENADTFAVDDEYMLGEDLLVAPVIEEGAESRSVYLPSGNWIDGNSGIVYEGRTTITYQARINVLPYFIRQGSSLDSSTTTQSQGETTTQSQGETTTQSQGETTTPGSESQGDTTPSPGNEDGSSSSSGCISASVLLAAILVRVLDALA